MSSLRILLVTIAVITMAILFSITINDAADVEGETAWREKYEKWIQHDIFFQSLTRYNSIYRNLKKTEDKESLSILYVRLIIDDMFLFPSKDSQSITVVLPENGQEGQIYVLQKIHIGEDNGLHSALRYLTTLRRRYVEPFEHSSRKLDQLIKYIITGDKVFLDRSENDLFLNPNKITRIL